MEPMVSVICTECDLESLTNVRLVHSFQNAMVHDEKLFLYRVERDRLRIVLFQSFQRTRQCRLYDS
jgi:hypothetical protein